MVVEHHIRNPVRSYQCPLLITIVDGLTQVRPGGTLMVFRKGLSEKKFILKNYQQTTKSAQNLTSMERVTMKDYKLESRGGQGVRTP